MQPRKLNVCFALFPYGGNGNTSSENPDIRNWMIVTYHKAKQDPRVGGVDIADYSDTPITMTRNRAVVEARKHDVDVLVMIDSDQRPDKYLPGMYPTEAPDPTAVPFWNTSFDFLYKHWEKGPVAIAAPYCGPPPLENIYCFLWRNHQSENPGDDFKLSQYTREEAVKMAGIQECAALPTGLSMFDMRIFELTEPKPNTLPGRIADQLAGLVGRTLDEKTLANLAEWLAQEKVKAEESWFYYEYTDRFQAEKCSTEDVTASRDLSIAGIHQYGYNPMHCAWSSWAGHWKPKCVGRPVMVPAESIAAKMTRIVSDNIRQDRRMVDVACEPPRKRVEKREDVEQRHNLPAGALAGREVAA